LLDNLDDLLLSVLLELAGVFRNTREQLIADNGREEGTREGGNYSAIPILTALLPSEI